MSEAGLLARTLDVVFSSINGCLAPSSRFVSDSLNQISRQPCLIPPAATLPGQRVCASHFGLAAPLPVGPSHQQYSLFISYVELYNDKIYDLLDNSAALNIHRESKKMREQASGRFNNPNLPQQPQPPDTLKKFIS